MGKEKENKIEEKEVSFNEKSKIPLIHIDDMTWGYQESKKILFKKFNFTLSKGDFVVVTGKSGTGKSTLVKFLI